MATLAQQRVETVQDGTRCRQMAKMTLSIVLKRLEEETPGGVVPIEQVRNLACQITDDSALLAACCGKMARDCQSDFLASRYDALRRNYLGRAVVKPFSPLLHDGSSGIDRRHLPQFFLALRMMLGQEAHAELSEKCGHAAAYHRGGEGSVDWVGFHEDMEVKAVLEAVRVGIARAFQRFDVRKDWLLTVMNSGNRAAGEFTPRHKFMLMSALFAPESINTYFCERNQVFTSKWGEEPETVFRPILTGLNALGAKLGR